MIPNEAKARTYLSYALLSSNLFDKSQYHPLFDIYVIGARLEYLIAGI